MQLKPETKKEIKDSIKLILIISGMIFAVGIFAVITSPFIYEYNKDLFRAWTLMPPICIFIIIIWVIKHELKKEKKQS